VRNHICAFLVSLAVSGALTGQGLTSVTGVTKDPSGAIIPGAAVKLVNADTGVQRSDVSDSQGRYTISQVQPGTYNITAQAPGFTDIALDRLQLLVNTPAVIDLTFGKVGTVVTAVEVSSEASQVNTQDASLGNAVGGHVITQLPFESRNVVGLLAIQPGVIYLGETNPGSLNDPRSGAVDGGKSDQGNVTLDGVDVNDQQNRASFTSVLGVTLDSVQEFRTTTTNAGAEYGHSSGAQVTMISRGGTNTVHGAAYEYLRNTDTSANSFFNNAAGVVRPKLDRNVFGVAVGGPIKKNRLFYFLNYEGRRDASAGSALRTVPNATFRTGTFTYINTSGGIETLTPAQVKAIDPAGIGADPAVLSLLQGYPLPNDNTVGDGLNTAGYRFNAPTPLRFNTYVSRFDYSLDSKNTIFWRGNLQNQNYANGIPEFPGQAPSSVYLNNSKGFATGLTSILSPTFVSTFRYGLTRTGVQNTGDLTSGYNYFDDLSSPYGTTAGTSQIIPVNDIHEDLVWTKGSHTFSFGGEVLLIRNTIDTNSHSYSTGFDNAFWLAGDGSGLLVADAKHSNNYIAQMANLLGTLPELTLQVNYSLTGNVLPQGTIINRTFGEQHYDLYLQDTWKARRGLTISVGLRYGLNPAIKEVNGYNVDSSEPMANFIAARSGYAAAGLSQGLAGPVTYALASSTGRGLYPFQADTAPRVAVAYSPQGTSGFSKFLFGGPDKTVIRGGWGMFYDAFGQGLERNFSSTAGFSTSVVTPPSDNPVTVPRFTGFYNLPPLSAFPPAPAGGFPQTAPLGSELNDTGTIDDQLKAPYTMNANFSVGRQFKEGFFVQLSLIDRQSRRSLVGEDFAEPTNLKDPTSGMTYFQAADLLGKMALNNTPVSQVPNIAFWQDMWPGAAGNGLTATQAVYNVYKANAPDWTTALYNVDIDCNPACSKLGQNSMFNSQFTGLFGYRSIGNGNYNGLHITVRKTFSQGYQFDFNYTWSKCEDLSSSPESSADAGEEPAIWNAWFPSQNKSVCDYDATEVFSALAVAQLPFGSGKKFLNTPNRLVNNVFGGWQLSGVFTATSGFPVSVANGVGWPTDWDCSCYATQTGIVPPTKTTLNAPSATPGTQGGPNIFANPAAAFAAYSPTMAGFIGQRNGIRGEGPFSIDLGLSKRFKLFTLRDQPHSLQLRAEGFNITNSVRFDASSASISYSNPNKFGQYSNTFGSPRVFQFSGRYEF
jgi:hypothetical protein